MGCDIHIILEKKFDKEWVGLFATDFTPKSHEFLITRRKYKFFAAIANVRNEDNRFKNILLPRGLPDDLSSLSKEIVKWAEEQYPPHNYTYVTIKEFSTIFIEVYKDQLHNLMKDHRYCLLDSSPASELFGINEEVFLDLGQKDYRVIIYFDN